MIKMFNDCSLVQKAAQSYGKALLSRSAQLQTLQICGNSYDVISLSLNTVNPITILMFQHSGQINYCMQTSWTNSIKFIIQIIIFP